LQYSNYWFTRFTDVLMLHYLGETTHLHRVNFNNPNYTLSLHRVKNTQFNRTTSLYICTAQILQQVCSKCFLPEVFNSQSIAPSIMQCDKPFQVSIKRCLGAATSRTGIWIWCTRFCVTPHIR